MTNITRLLIASFCLLSPVAHAETSPGAGRLLIATELVGGPAFRHTVVLILRYNDAGTLGLIVNRPTDIDPAEALPDLDGVARYEGSLFFGGPVGMHTLRLLLRTETPPEDAVNVFGNVYMVPLTEALLALEPDASSLRLYLGYAGWSPGQLERELLEGSWNIAKATTEAVFSPEPGDLWKRLKPAEILQAAR
ncbi:MAG: YqgE/AlgH family protein [Gammaproteobacteria bacterium]|nr:YqgE/AlgH family protein [Gammaproteobacteria bacterium]